MAVLMSSLFISARKTRGGSVLCNEEFLPPGTHQTEKTTRAKDLCSVSIFYLNWILYLVCSAERAGYGIVEN